MGAVEGPSVVSPVISTPDQRLRVFVSSTLGELAPEREAVRSAIKTLRLTPVMFELGARPHPPADVYRSYLEQSDVFVGIYWESYGWVAPGETLSGIADELALSSAMPRLIYVKEPATERDPSLEAMLSGLRTTAALTYRTFTTPDELATLLLDDLAVLVTERFHGQESSGLEGGTLTFMFADLEGSTGMLQRLGDGYQALLGSYHRIVNAAVGRNRGHVVTTEGDGFFCVFPTPAQALDTAHEIMDGMASSEWPAGETPRCRIGLHTGTATRTMEGYVGMDVHVAARIGAAANGGQVIISSTTSGLSSDFAESRDWRITDLGQFELKGIDRSERLLRVDMPDLDVVVVTPRARPRTPTNVPATPKQLIGRDDDVNGATEMLLRDSVRLVTLTGTGGTGKTRLAIEVARSVDREFPDGVVYIDLSAVRDAERFLPVVGRALGVRESPERTIVSGLHTVLGDARMLLVLDNLEQLLPTAGSQVGDIIMELPNVKILATSRSPLRIGWEHEYPLPPLDVPEPGAGLEEIDESAAVQLFMERAQAVRPLFELNEVTRPVVVDVTRRLDGLPLAIELAAARLRVFTIEELQQRLDDSLGVLDKASPDSPERHRTLRSAIQWSHDLLEDDERVLFRRLSVFSGGWTLPAAVAICGDDGFPESRVVDAMENLVAKSLVVFSIDTEGRPRYRLLETLREFGAEELVRHDEEAPIHLRHLTWFRTVAEKINVVLQTPAFPGFLDEVERDRFNVREALAWSVRNRSGTDDALKICGMLPLFWDTRGYVAEGLRWTRALVAMTTSEGDTEPRGMAHTAMGWLEMLAGEPDESEWALSTAVDMFRRLGNDNWLGRALSMQGMTTYNRELLDEAEEQFNEAIVLCRQEGLDWLADAWCTYGLAHIALGRGDFPTADRLLHHCLDYSKGNGLLWGVGHCQLSLGVMSFMMGDLEQSVERLIESLLLRQELRDSRGLCDCLGMMALQASVRGEHEFAAVLIGAAEAAREASGDHLVPWMQPLMEQAIIGATTELGDDYEPNMMKGRALSVGEAIALILDRFPVGDRARISA